MKNLKQVIEENVSKGTAIGHFNVPNLEVAQAVVDASIKMNLPVILGVSEGEREYIGVKRIRDWVDSVNGELEERRRNFAKQNSPAELAKIDNAFIYLNADHTYSFEKVKEVVDAGYDMVIYDDAAGDLQKNIEVAKKCRDYIDTHNSQNCGSCWLSFFANSKTHEVLLEAEIGYIGKGSEVRTELPGGLQKTSPEDAEKFVKAVKPDLLAPAVGNVHGMLKNMPNPKLDDKLCGEIFKTTQTPLVLHGASGNTKEDIQACIKNGVAIVHISTEIRVAYKKALEEAVKGEDLAAYKYLKPVREAVQKLVEDKIKIFNFID